MLIKIKIAGFCFALSYGKKKFHVLTPDRRENLPVVASQGGGQLHGDIQ